MGQQKRIQTLRQLLSTPHQKNWWMLWSEVESWPTNEALKLERDYLTLHLQNWPDHIKLLHKDAYKPWLEGAEHLLLPFVRGISLVDLGPDGDPPRIHESPYAHHITHLALRHWARTSDQLKEFFGKRSFSLTSLAWHRGKLNTDTLQTLLRLPSLQGLRRLILPFNALREEDCQSLLMQGPATLQSLDLSNNHIDRGGAQMLLMSPRLPQLTSLSLDWNPLHGAGTWRGVSRALKSLRLAYNHLSPPAFLHLLQEEITGTLTELDVSGNPLGPQHILAMVRLFPTLHSLNLRCTDLGDKGALALADALPPEVGALDLSFTGISPQTLRVLQAHPNLAQTVITCEPIQSTDLDIPETNTHFTIRHAGDTNTGPIRTHNEDAFVALPALNTYTVADGMGGQSSGSVVSHLITQALTRRLGPTQGTLEDTSQRQQRTPRFCREIFESEALLISSEVPPQAEGFMIRQVSRANELLLQHNLIQYNSTRDSGACFAGAAIHGDRATLAHIGFARIYRWRQGTLTRLTEDDSLVNEQINMGNLTPLEAQTYPFQNIVLRCVGLGSDFALTTRHVQLAHEDFYLLCTDGLWKTIGEEGICNIFQENISGNALPMVCAQLMNAAIRLDANDNIALVLLFVEEEAEA